MINYFITLLYTIETAINIEEEFETGEYPVQYSVQDIENRAQAVLNRVSDPFWGFKHLSDGDQKAFWELFDELLERESVRKHCTFPVVGVPTLAPELEEYVLPF